MDTYMIVVILLVIMAVLVAGLVIAFAYFDMKERYRLTVLTKYGDIPEEVMDRIKQLWQQSPELLTNLDKNLAQYHFLTDMDTKEKEEKKERMAQYAKLEERWKEKGYEPEAVDVTLEEFQLWTVLVAKYPTERSLLVERELQRICSHISRNLTPEDRATLLLLNRRAADEAVDFWNAFGCGE